MRERKDAKKPCPCCGEVQSRNSRFCEPEKYRRIRKSAVANQRRKDLMNRDSLVKIKKLKEVVWAEPGQVFDRAFQLLARG